MRFRKLAVAAAAAVMATGLAVGSAGPASASTGDGSVEAGDSITLHSGLLGGSDPLSGLLGGDPKAASEHLWGDKGPAGCEEDQLLEDLIEALLGGDDDPSCNDPGFLGGLLNEDGD